MASVEFRIVVYDTETAQRVGRWGDVGFSLSGITEDQARTMVRFMETFKEKLESQMGLIKHGVGDILPEDDDAPVSPKVAATAALAHELVTEGDEDEED